jgi:hypothetical protein
LIKCPKIDQISNIAEKRKKIKPVRGSIPHSMLDLFPQMFIDNVENGSSRPRMVTWHQPPPMEEIRQEGKKEK